jgi:O-methyltransferase
VKGNPCPSFATRVDLYRFVNDTHLAAKSLCLVELGVWKGETIKNWTLLNSDPKSRFYGLDTFEGLPEEWQHLLGSTPIGTFSSNGALPNIDDPRLSFVKGLIQEKLQFLLMNLALNASRLVVHYDADLYSTTLYGLTSIDCILLARMDSYIAIFDEFSSANDEFRAFVDYCGAYRRRFKVLGHVGKSYNQVAINIYR